MEPFHQPDSSTVSGEEEYIEEEEEEEEEVVYEEEEMGEEDEVYEEDEMVASPGQGTEVKAAVDSKNGLKADGGGAGGGTAGGGTAGGGTAGGGTAAGGTAAAAGGGEGGGPKYTMFTWFVVLALLGVWSSVAVVYFDVMDYDSVIARAKEFRVNFSEVLQGKLMAYDRDGDGDFDMEDAKVLLGFTTDAADSENAESLEEVLDILAEEGSEWFYGFFTFLHDIVTSPVERGVEVEVEEDEEGDEDSQAATRREGGAAPDDMVEGVILDLLNQ